MYSFIYKFYPLDMDSEDYRSHVLFYLSSLFRNGQIVGDDNGVVKGDVLEYTCTCPATDSLDPRHHNEYGAKEYEKLIAASKREPEPILSGITLNSGMACECGKPSGYVLFTTFAHYEPPVICQDCGGHVPLYLLPYPGGDDEHGRIIGWQNVYRACDQLYMSGVGERYGMRQIRDPKSALSQEGLEICREMASLVSKPFYYYLWTNPDRPTKHCPSCKGEWRETKKIARMFDKICDVCGFVTIGYD